MRERAGVRVVSVDGVQDVSVVGRLSAACTGATSPVVVDLTAASIGSSLIGEVLNAYQAAPAGRFAVMAPRQAARDLASAADGAGLLVADDLDHAVRLVRRKTDRSESRSRRLAHNEVLFKRAHDAISERARELGAPDRGSIAFFCECGDIDCTQRIIIPASEYDAARTAPTMFLVMPGHEQTEVEVVVARAARYTMVEKWGVAEQVLAELSDGR